MMLSAKSSYNEQLSEIFLQKGKLYWDWGFYYDK
jgi:hypothetical protein